MKCNICMIAYTIYPTDARVRREAETMAAQPDCHVSVFALKQGLQPRVYTLDGVRVIELNVGKYQGKSTLHYVFSYLQFILRAFMGCNRMLLKGSLDAVHVHNMPNLLVLSAFLARLAGKKIVLDVHDTLIETYLAKFDECRENIMCRIMHLEEFISAGIANQVVCVNHVQKEALMHRGIPARKITTVLNVPDPNLFHYRPWREQLPTDTDSHFKLIYHGTIARRLGIDMAIQAVAELVEQVPAIEYHIAGNGDDQADFIRLVKQLGIEEHVRFHGMVPLEGLNELLQDMDLCVISNRKNAATQLMLPVKMLECLALGVPVAAPRLQTIEHYFSDDMVFYFEPDNVDSLAESILRAFKNPQERQMKAQNAKRFLERYGWQTHKQDLIHLYDHLFS